MEVKLLKGKYVVAVSGGVDSVVLLHLLAGTPGIEIVVAHFDHGIREESAQDEVFVGELAGRYDSEYVSDRAELGAGASEALARERRYEFLRRQKDVHGAGAIVTAHHQDDLHETMILNMLRGTGRRGLDPFVAYDDIARPLVTYTKDEIIAYALAHGLSWSEDSTNTDQAYRRNYVRHSIMPKLPSETLRDLNVKMRVVNQEIDTLLADLDTYLLDADGAVIRARFVGLPHVVASEWMLAWLLKRGVTVADKEVVHKAVIAVKTLLPGKKMNLGKRFWLYAATTVVQILPV